MRIEHYTSWLKEHGKSEHTVTNYVRIAKMFQQWVQSRLLLEEFDPLCVSPLELQEFKTYLLHEATYERKTEKTSQKKNYSVTTIRTYIKSVKTYFEFLLEIGEIRINPAIKLRPPKVQSDYDEEPRWLERKERSKLLNYTNDPVLKKKNEWRFYRNRAIVYSGLYAGLRRSEMTNLNLDDLVFDRSSLYVRAGKGDKSRWLPMNQDLREALQDWLAVRGEQDHKFVFLSQRGNPLSPNGVWNLCLKIGMQLHFEDFSPHSLRHTFGHDLAENGQPIQYIADLLGHSDLNYTRVYIKPSKEEKRKAVDALGSE